MPRRSIAVLQIVLSLAVFLPSSASATDCSRWSQWSAPDAYLTPLSVPPEQLDEHLNGSPWLDGVQLDATMRGRELWLDVVHFPGDTTAAAAGRILFIVGRLAGEGFDTLVLAENGQGLFAIDEPLLREIGCQFIWGREGGQNPIHLMRLFYRALRDYPTGGLVEPGFDGSLLGDTSLAMAVNNEILIPRWVLSAVR